MLSRLLGVRPASATVKYWHVSPLVDSLAYHWSWTFALAPMLMFGNSKADYIGIWAVVMALNFAHRHLSVPLVYTDTELLKQRPVVFALAPLLVVAVFVAEPLLVADTTWNKMFLVIASVSGAWGVWHTLQQKYGILRMYAAKSELPPAERAPAWLDRLLVYGCVPLWVAVVSTHYSKALTKGLPNLTMVTKPILQVARSPELSLMPVAMLIAAGSVTAFVAWEWKTQRFANRARLFMGLGTACLSASVLVFDPMKVVLAYSFSHSLEYFVFVWAYERRRFAQASAAPSLLGRIVRRPALAYLGFGLITGLFYVACRHVGKDFLHATGTYSLLGTPSSRWIYYWGLSQSMLHFYFDSFMWKMRSSVVRGNI
jgi:hypothetical protein